MYETILKQSSFYHEELARTVSSLAQSTGLDKGMIDAAAIAPLIGVSHWPRASISMCNHSYWILCDYIISLIFLLTVPLPFEA